MGGGGGGLTNKNITGFITKFISSTRQNLWESLIQIRCKVIAYNNNYNNEGLHKLNLIEFYEEFLNNYIVSHIKL